jgi:ATP-dependent helicase HrpA
METATLTPTLDELRARLPGCYPPELPVSQRKDEIVAAIREHQVVIVAGETGSGKTTQLPKICLEAGRGAAGQIGHTQPRRIAARTVAERIAAELKVELGSTVGYQVRFNDTSSDDTLIKVMTDGILLNELQRDRDLRRYDTLIIDEAHERSLNVDFILGYLKRLLPRRPDLKVIITSATIDPDRFSDHFDRAPVILVSGRTYPVEVRYRPLGDPDTPAAPGRDQIEGITDALAELRREGSGDVLVFLSGEREIRDTADALSDLPGTEVLPLYARLSAAEQHRVFQPHQNRRVVLATNVAETSLTVPGIRYVIDPGTARISRYSNRTKVQRLPIEPISRASADQRKGRCGRTSDGICIRLYSEEDYDSRPEFTDPEILRTSLASVILRMAALDLGEVAGFPFLDPPDARNVADGIRLLEELGALAPGRGRGPRRLTGAGRKLARLPADPRLGRMILAADRNGCLTEVLIIAAALSITDPRERPADAREAADAQHARFAEPGSDFLALLNLWDYLRAQQRELSSSAFRRQCRREYLHYLRVREWQDVYGQLRQAAADLGLRGGHRQPLREAEPAGPKEADTRVPHGRAARRAARGKPNQGQPSAGPASPDQASPDQASPDQASPAQASPAQAGGPGSLGGRISASTGDQVHRSLLAGLLSHLGMRETAPPPPRGQRRPLPEFAGARGARFAIFPDSALTKKPPPWVIAAELVETSRLWARTVAGIEPEWAEEIAGNLVRRSYSEPRWDAQRGAAMATEKVLLYGLPIVAARPVSLSRVDPAAARELFISHALVEGDWTTQHRFFHDNRRRLDEAAELERKARRRGLVADEHTLYQFYDERIPASVISARHFDTWWKEARAADPGLLTLSQEDLAGPAADEVSAADYPAAWDGLALEYEFEPGAPEDGVTVDIPLARLSQVTAEELGWQVPGLREELITELIRSLPKQLRRSFVPAPQTAHDVLARLGEPRGSLLDALSAELDRMTGVTVPRSAWDPDRLPAHLRVSYRVLDGPTVLAQGKDLAGLRTELRPRLQQTLTAAASSITRTGLRGWDIAALPRTFTSGQATGYPALTDTGDAADVQIFDTEQQAAAEMTRGIARLLAIAVPSGARAVASRLPARAKLAMSRQPYPSVPALLDDCTLSAADQIVAGTGGPVWDAAGYARLLAAAQADLPAATATVVSAAARALGLAQEAEAGLAQSSGPEAALADMREQLAGLVYPGFIRAAGASRLRDVARYLQGIVRRLEKMPEDTQRDAERMAAVHRSQDAWRQARAELTAAGRSDAPLQPVRWLIEELRVSLFAQSLGTSRPVSEQRIEREIARLAGD